MRILIYGINYAPELTGIGKYTGEMAVWFKKQGHEVHVLTAMPYYPEWEVHRAYRKMWWHTELIDSVFIHRTPLYVPKNVTPIKRIIHEFSFLASSFPFFIHQLFRRKFDVVLCVAPPFHLAMLPLFYKSLRRTVLISHIQDLQVDAARNLGMIKSKIFLEMMDRIERFLLRKSTKVSTISDGMMRKILAKRIEPSKLLLFPNWVDAQTIHPLPKEDSMRDEFGFSASDKIVLYSGNLGEKQGLEAIIHVAKKFTNDTNVKFVICGSGGAKERLMRLAEEQRLTLVYFFPLQPYAKLSRLLAMADLHLVLQKLDAADLVMPSKLTGILAAGGCPLVTALPGTSLYDVIVNNQIGIVIPPEDLCELEKGIRKGLYEDNTIHKENARAYAERHLEKEQVLSDFEEKLLTLINH